MARWTPGELQSG